MMCGITGWADFKKQLIQQDHVINQMTDTLSNEGRMIQIRGKVSTFFSAING